MGESTMKFKVKREERRRRNLSENNAFGYFGHTTKVMVENRATGEQVEVKITDRGPYVDKKRRIIDLSKAAADSVGIVEEGVAPVRVVVTEEAAKQTKNPDEALVYEIQVGAFEQEDHAKAVLEQVQDWFPQAYMTPHAKAPRVRITASA